MSNENNTDDWKPYRIIPQSVLVRQVTDQEGEMIYTQSKGLRLVRPGNYVVRLENGELWIADKDAFLRSYEPRETEPK